MKPFVSIIIPCYQEEKFIEKCLKSLIENTYPKQRLEILVMDGGSEDKSREIVKEYESKYDFIKLKNNSRRFQVYAFNAGIKESRGEIIMLCGAHSKYDSQHIERLVSWLQRDENIAAVGGIWVNELLGANVKKRAIAYTLSHPFCVGVNRYRIGSSKAVFVDTVPFGAYRKKVIEKIGGFNERFLRGEDLELNMRLKKAGYKILLDPEIKIYYYPRESFSKLFKMMFQYGYWRNFVNKELKIISSLRQVVPPLFIIYVISLIFLSFLSLLFIFPLLIYLFLLLFFSLLISIQKKDIKAFPFCILTFIATHTGYGLGYIKGFWDIWVLRKKDSTGGQAEITR